MPRYEGAPWRAAIHSALVLAAIPFVTFILPFLFAPIAVPIALPLHCAMQLVCVLRITTQVPLMCGSAMFRQAFVRQAFQGGYELLQLLSFFSLAPLPSGPRPAQQRQCRPPGQHRRPPWEEQLCQLTLETLLLFVGLWVPTALQAAAEWGMYQRFRALQQQEAAPEPGGGQRAAASGGFGGRLDPVCDRIACWLLPCLGPVLGRADAALLAAATIFEAVHILRFLGPHGG